MSDEPMFKVTPRRWWSLKDRRDARMAARILEYHFANNPIPPTPWLNLDVANGITAELKQMYSNVPSDPPATT